MIELHSLRKVYGSKIAVKNLSLNVEKGQVLGLLGPNGAGKSTTMKMLCGCLRPTSGRALLNGEDVWKNPIAAKRYLGFLPESAPSYEEQTVSEFLKFFAALSGLRGQEKQRAVSQSIDRCFLNEVRNQSIDTLSKGYRHRVCLAQSIIHDPPVIIFDEPTDGLDPNQKHEIRRLIDSIRSSKAIILSTHILEEVDAICTDVVMLAGGEVVSQGTPEELRNKSFRAQTILLRSKDPQCEAIAKELEAIEDVKQVILQSPTNLQIVTIDASEQTQDRVLLEIRSLIQENNWPILEVAQQEGDLAEVFRDLTFSTKKGDES